MMAVEWQASMRRSSFEPGATAMAANNVAEGLYHKLTKNARYTNSIGSRSTTNTVAPKRLRDNHGKLMQVCFAALKSSHHYDDDKCTA
jgi:hypothetical protein